MSASVLLFGILPLLAFVVIDSFAGLKTGVLAAIVFAVVEAGYTLVVYKTVDGLTVGSLVLVLVFGLLSYRSKKSIYIKLQPVFLGSNFGIVLLVMQALGKPLMVMVAEKYQYAFPEELRATMTSPELMTMVAKLSGVLGWGFLVHAGIIAYSAFKMSNWWWLIIRGIGLYVMLFACVLLARLT